jgi:DnaK suppressor protein
MEKHKEHLLAIEAELAKRITALSAGVDLGNDVDGLDEVTDQAEEFGTNLGVREALEERLENVQDALRKIEHGTYGVCESCGGKIEEEILSIDPESALCRNCKKNLKE